MSKLTLIHLYKKKNVCGNKTIKIIKLSFYYREPIISNLRSYLVQYPKKILSFYKNKKRLLKSIE